VVEAVDPLGANQWTEAAHMFKPWAGANDRRVRDQDLLKKRFEKLANAKKKRTLFMPP